MFLCISFNSNESNFVLHVFYYSRNTCIKFFELILFIFIDSRTSSSSSGRGLPIEEPAVPSASSTTTTLPTTTTVVYNFNDEEFPFRKKIAGYPITLKQFIECMPKKGHYR